GPRKVGARVGCSLSGQQPGSRDNVYPTEVAPVTFSPDSQLIASSSLDSTIRVWDTQKCLATPQNSDYWTMNEDGWVVGHDSSLLFWVPADLRPMLRWPQNTILINQQGSFELDFTDAALGPRWTECWKSE
ncbi:hypothetical protein FRC12_005510, partial [Ceratobasidium sp. 428]